MTNQLSLFPILFAWSQITDLKNAYVNEHESTHFVCSEPIQCVDISADKVVGDMPLSNMLRIKPIQSNQFELGIVTIAAQHILRASQLTRYELL